ncbi:MAG: hypothetical protein ABEH77_00575, partial [Halobacteriaceae archaeon]
MYPTRRDVLAAGGLLAVAALAGCLGAVQPPRNDDRPDGGDPGSDTRPGGTGGPGLSLAAVDAAPGLPVRPSVEITRDTATADHPPQLRVTVTNGGEEAVRVGEGRDVVFAYVQDTDRQLMLLPAEGNYPAEPDCWRLSEPVAVTEEYRVIDLAPGESVSALVDLYGAPGPDACL